MYRLHSVIERNFIYSVKETRYNTKDVCHVTEIVFFPKLLDVIAEVRW